MDNITQNGLQGNSKFPGLSQEQIDRLEQVTADLTGIEKQQRQQALYQGVLQQINQDKINNDRMQAENELYYKSTQEKDPKQQNYLQSNVRQEQLADLVKEKRNLRTDANTQDVINALMQEAQVKGVSVDSLNSYLAGESDDFIYEMGLAERPEENNIGKDIAVAGAIGGTATALTDVAVRGVGKVASKVGEKLYKSTIDPTIREAREIQRAGANLKDAKIAVQDAKAELKQAKKLGEGVEEAQNVLNEAEKNLKTVKAKKVNTVADTAMEYNVGEGLTEGWSSEDRGIQARSKANQIFKKTINPALEKSTSTINVQGLIDDLTKDIADLAKNDPDKLKAYEDALGSLKESYSDGKFANYSLKDSQTLKSGLQGRTPQKFFKGNEVTNELQELKGILSGKLKNAVHGALTKELGQDTAKLYKDWANLTEYADNLASASTKGPSKGGFGGFMDWVANKADPIKQKAGLLLNKGGNKLNEAGIGGKQVVEMIKNGTNRLINRGSKQISKIKPDTWLDGLKGTLVKAGANPETIDKAVNLASKSKSISGKVLTKVMGPLLKVAGDIALPMDATNSLSFIEDHADMYSTIPLLYAKQNWKNGNPSDDFKGWTEEDRENIGLSDDDIYNILNSDEFKEVDEKTSWGGDRLYKQFLSLTHNKKGTDDYSPIVDLS